MLHTKASSLSSDQMPTQQAHKLAETASNSSLSRPGPTLVARFDTAAARRASSPRLLDLAAIVSRRCSSFFAEAAVLVLVFGILDFFILKGRIDLSWMFGALAISLGLLAASIAMDFTAQRWIKAHP